MTYLSSDTFIELCKEHHLNIDAISAAIKTLGKGDSQKHHIRARIANYQRKGLLPLDSGNTVTQGTVLRGTSTLFDSEGSVVMQWVKTDVAKESALEAFESAIQSITDRVVPVAPVASPTGCMDHLLSIYTIGDAHIGMLAHAPESGADNDLTTIESSLVGAMRMLVQQSLPTNEAFIIDVGDYQHSDNPQNRTAKSGNALDVDGRYHKVLEVSLRLATELIDLALQKHAIVRWRSAIGNHNETSAIMMNQFIKAYYRNEPRVIVHDSPSMFMYHQFGKNLIGITHGHTVKPDKLGEIMAVDCESIWSSTKFRYWYIGHIHHQSVKEYPSCVVESFRTLAGKDAWHFSSGYRSGQDMKCITLHQDYGEIARNTVNIAMLQ